MGTLIAFLVGLIVGGCFGMMCTAVISIDRMDDNMDELWEKVECRLREDGWNQVVIDENEKINAPSCQNTITPGTVTSEDIELSLDSYRWYSDQPEGRNNG